MTMFEGTRLRFFVACSVIVTGLSLFTAAYSHAGTAQPQCLDQPDQRLSESDPRYRALQQAVNTYFSERQKAEGFSGLSLHISLSADGPVFDVTAGSTSFQGGQSICPDTLWEIGSITKSFTSVLTLQLEAAGLLDIHDTLGKWLPQYPEWSNVTIEQLLNLTAPTRDYLGDQAYEKAALADIHRTFSPQELVGYAYAVPAGPRPPWQYINTNYILAGMIISKATGLSYAEALGKMLFEPLHLHGAYYQPRVPPHRVLARMPSGYDNFSECELANLPPLCPEFPLDAWLGQDMKTVNLSNYDASGGIIAPLADVTRWVRALFSNTLLPPKQKAELFSLVSEVSGLPIAAPSSTDSSGYALGIGQALLPFVVKPVWIYEGETYGSRAVWVGRPEDDLVIVMAFNSAVPPSRDEYLSLYHSAISVLEPQSVVDP
jgi:D-alanyl-D-alanine carboxypeptidase